MDYEELIGNSISGDGKLSKCILNCKMDSLREEKRNFKLVYLRAGMGIVLIMPKASLRL